MRKDTPTLDADAHPLVDQLAMLRHMTKEFEHEIDDILADASEVVGAAPAMNRSKVIKALVADNRKKLLHLQAYLVALRSRGIHSEIRLDALGGTRDFRPYRASAQ